MLNHNNMHVDNVTFRLDLVMLRDDKMPIDALNLSYKVVNAQLTTTDIDFQLLQAVARWTKLCLSRGATRWSSRRWPQNFQPHKLSWSFERSPTDIPTFWFPIFFISRPLSLVTLWPAFFLMGRRGMKSSTTCSLTGCASGWSWNDGTNPFKDLCQGGWSLAQNIHYMKLVGSESKFLIYPENGWKMIIAFLGCCCLRG